MISQGSRWERRLLTSSYMTRSLLLVLGFAILSGCAAASGEEAAGASGEALTGDVAVGTTVETTTALRIRRSPSTESSSNILGILPAGTKVKILASKATEGFYNVEVLDDALARKLKTDKGWCFGEHLLGGSEDPQAEAEAEAEAEEPTPAAPAGRTFKAQFESKNCRPLKDDRNEFMSPTIDEFVINAGGEVETAAIAINSNVLPYGTLLTIPEVDAKPAISSKGRSVVFKVVKTTPTASDNLVVTLCTMASGFLPARGTELTLIVK